MNCECKKEWEAKIAEKLKAKLPEGYENFNAELKSYSLGFGEDNKLVSMVCIPYEGSVMVPKKSGGLKKQKIGTFLKASFCPFCGKEAD